MPAKKILDELSTAVKTEISGYFFYNAAAILVGEDKGKNVFSNLAKEELDHIRVISRIAESVKAGGKFLSYDEAMKEGAPAVQGLPIFQTTNELIKKLESNPTDINAVNIAVENEEGAVEFYSRLLKEASAADEKVALTKLLEMEKAHLKILRWESESLRKTGFWCGDMEYSVEKELD